MRLTVVGCSGSFPGPDSAASCYLLEAPYDDRTYRLLLDLGSGALGPLQRHVELESIDAVALTHLHADHCLDLCGLFVVCRYHPGGPMGPLRVHGPAGTADRIAAAYGLDERSGMSQAFDFHTYPEGPFEIGPFEVSVTRVDHPGTAYAIRVSHGDRTLVYSGDTGPCTSLEQLAKGCDVLLAEASFVDEPGNPPNLHLTGKEAAQVAERAGVGRLLLTHVPPWHDRETILAEAQPHFGGETSLALPGRTLDV
ncbi:MAG: MBL fold metallo-hydrolase [Nocardioidaceae bacterium]|nr:MBL fold metallo-hydrolase [Nocardioidaceae bacterium]